MSLVPIESIEHTHGKKFGRLALTVEKVGNQVVIEGFAEKACLGLFAQHGISLATRCEVIASKAAKYVGLIGFTGDLMRGTLLLSIGDTSLEASLPEGIVPNSESKRDWISELSNQLLGRIKNQLLRRGAEIYLTMPLVLRGEHLSPLPRKHCNRVCFDTPTGQIQVWVDCEYAEGYQIPDEDLPGAGELPSEGDALLF